MKLFFKIFAIAVASVFAIACGNAQNEKSVSKEIPAEVIAHFDTLWQRQFNDAGSIIALYDSIKQLTAKDEKEIHTLNQCHFVWNSGEYMFRCRGKNSDIFELPKHCTKLSFDDNVISQFTAKRKIDKLADHYFTLQAMKSGSSFDDARDGVTATVFYPIRALNDNDYNKLHAIFNCNNSKLHNEYLKRLKFPLNNSGCTSGLKSIQPVIERNVAESELKREILAIYELFTRIMPGNPAPLSTFKDTEGNEHTFADYKGKVLVIDIWATWCHSCLTNMQHFLDIKNLFKEADDVCFATISIDRSEDKEQWLQAIENNNMQGLINLFPDCPEQSQFESDFQISSVPRYIIIGKKGEIVSAHAPIPSPEMAAMIEKARLAEF